MRGEGGREAIVLRLISLLACLPIAFDRDLFPPLLPLLTSSFLPLFPPPPSMNANSSIDTLSISHFVPPIPACFLLPLSQGPCNVSGYAGKSFRSQQSHDEEMGSSIGVSFCSSIYGMIKAGKCASWTLPACKNLQLSRSVRCLHQYRMIFSCTT